VKQVGFKPRVKERGSYGMNRLVNQNRKKGEGIGEHVYYQ